MTRDIITAERLKASLAVPDLSDPVNGVHAINLLVSAVSGALAVRYPDASLLTHRTNPVVPIADNFDRLLFPAKSTNRDSRYTRYVDMEHVLRTHTSAAIPSLLMTLDWSSHNHMLTLPGICFRRDVVDRTHCPEPHQMDVWRIRRGGEQLCRADLLDLIGTIVNSVLPSHEYRCNETEHPYTLRGLEVEVRIDGNWLEVLECGEAHPCVLADAGLDPDKHSGLALGMGLDRLVMLVKRISDIRVLRSPDPRIAKQMRNLKVYTPVSNQQVAKRTLSFTSNIGLTEEDVCESIQDAMGGNVRFLEEVGYKEFAFNDLPEHVCERLGMTEGQKNVVVELSFRSLEGTMPRHTVNAWMQDIYPVLNQGTGGYM